MEISPSITLAIPTTSLPLLPSVSEHRVQWGGIPQTDKQISPHDCKTSEIYTQSMWLSACKCHPKKQDVAVPGNVIRAWRNVEESCNQINGLNSWRKNMWAEGEGWSAGSAGKGSQGTNICHYVSRPVEGESCFFDHRHKYAVHPISLWMPQSSSNSLPLFSFHARKQPLDYNLAFHVDFPTGENALTSQHEHLVHLARSVLFVYECIGVLVYTSVSSYAPGAAEVLALPALPEPTPRFRSPLFAPSLSLGWGQRIRRPPQLPQIWAQVALDLHLPCRGKGHGPTTGAAVRVVPQDLPPFSGIWSLLLTQFSPSYTLIPSGRVHSPS